jgi:large subunit ribosomal protein L23
MKSPYDVILKPVVTERSMDGLAGKKYTFYVAGDANKIEIKKAVETIFSVQVESVNTIKLPAKPKRMGVHQGYTTARKKAVVTLTPGSKTIEFFEGMI